jgi:hypothetical protein
LATGFDYAVKTLKSLKLFHFIFIFIIIIMVAIVVGRTASYLSFKMYFFYLSVKIITNVKKFRQMFFIASYYHLDGCIRIASVMRSFFTSKSIKIRTVEGRDFFTVGESI